MFCRTSPILDKLPMLYEMMSLTRYSVATVTIFTFSNDKILKV